MGLDHWLTRGRLNDKDRETVLTWRKENWLHNWFITHCAPEGYDEESQKPIGVTKENIIDLCGDIQSILDKVKELGVDVSEIKNEYEREASAGKGLGLDELEQDKVDQLIHFCENKMPTRSGFFFGSVEYDHWYFESLKDELKDLNEVLENWIDEKEYWYEVWW